MDFFALPRRDLQALCKRNGVRANMTNAAMADALRALPKVDGIEEYVQQPVAVPEPEVKALVGEQNTGKQGYPPPRGHHAVATASEPIETAEDHEEEKGNPKRQRAPIPRGRHVKAKGSSTDPIRLDDSDDEEKEDAKPQVEHEDAQILGMGRRGGARRRAQAAPAVAVPEGQIEDEQRAAVTRGHRAKAKSTELIRLELDDSKEHTKPEEERGGAPAIGVGRRGASRRAPAPSEAPATRRSAAASKAEAGDVAVEDVPIRATRHRKPTMKAASAAEEKAPRRATRRGAVMSTQLQQVVQEEPQEAVRAPDVVVEAVPVPTRATRQRKPTMKAVAAAGATAEEKAPSKVTRRGAVMRTLLPQDVLEEPQDAVCPPVSYQRCDTLEELEKASDPQKEELSEVDAPKQDKDEDMVIIEDAKLMAETLAEYPPVTNQECTDKSELQEQQVDDEKCHQPEVQEEPQEAVGAPFSYQQYDAREKLEEATDPKKEELNEVDSPKQDEDEDVVIIEDEKLIEESPAEDPPVIDQECTDKSEMQEQQVDDDKCHAPLAFQEESPILGLVSTVTEHASLDDEETLGAPVSYQRCVALEELEGASDPQKEELIKVDASKQDEDQGCVMIEDEKLMEESLAEEPSVTDQERMDKSEMQGQHVDDESWHAPLANQKESLIHGLVSTVTEQAFEDDEGTSFQVNGGSSSGPLDKGVCEDTYDASEEMVVPGVTSSSIITMEPSVCKNSCEEDTEPIAVLAEPKAVLEEKGVKVAREFNDLTKLSLRQLRAKIKEKLNAKKNKKTKRVALATVDENVCRSHAKGQQQNLNLQQH